MNENTYGHNSYSLKAAFINPSYYFYYTYLIWPNYLFSTEFIKYKKIEIKQSFNSFSN